jgi:MinD superfamily P-loop ATPase
MMIAVASGKGGTGKTTVAVSLALALATQQEVQYLDCDVEEPNGHLFLKPRFFKKTPVTVPVPRLKEEKCTFCGRCAQVCAYHAVAVLPENVLFFPELCHSCGGCWHFCPEKALFPAEREIGCLEEGRAGKISFVHGRLNVGVASGTPLIRAVKERRAAHLPAIVDAPPGTSCAALETVRGADFCLLVTEPTPFGLHDLELAAEMAEELGVPSGVVLNRSCGEDGEVEIFCRLKNLPLLTKIPLAREVAAAYSRAEPPLAALPGWQTSFLSLWKKCREVSGA